MMHPAVKGKESVFGKRKMNFLLDSESMIC